MDKQNENEVVKTNSPRDPLLDFLRGVVMIFVLLHHSGFPLGEYILAFHMPLFFIISGYLASKTEGFNKPFKNFIKRKALRLVVPYFSFEIVNLLIWVCIRCFTHQSLPDYKSLISILLCISDIYPGMYGRLWFLPCLFVAEIYVYIILKLAKNNKLAQIIATLGLFACSFAIGRMLVLPYGRLPFTMDTAFFGAGFVMIGFIFNDVFKTLISKENIILKILLAIGCLLYLYYALRFTYAKCYMFIDQYGEYTVTICSAIAGSIAFLILGSLSYNIISKVKFLNNFVLWYGKNSLASFPVHLTIKMFIIWGAPILAKWYYMFLVMLFLNVPIVYVITKFFPFMLGQKYKTNKNVTTNT